MLQLRLVFGFLILLTILSIWTTLNQKQSIGSSEVIDTGDDQLHISCSGLQTSFKTSHNLSSVDTLLPHDDLRRLINLSDFEFTMNLLPCSSFSWYNEERNDQKLTLTGPLLLIFVHSAPTNFARRLLIRQTWGSWMPETMRLLFLLGAVNSTVLQESLEKENRIFLDLIQGNFIDAYRNMTYKHVMALKWFSLYCPEAKFVLKTDDDIFVNTPFLLKYLEIPGDCRDLIICDKHVNERVGRSFRTKWRIRRKEYPDTYYPDFCPGFAIIYSPDVVVRLYIEAQRTKYFWVDDVHVTGVLSKKANIAIRPFDSVLWRKVSCTDVLAGRRSMSSFIVTAHNIPEEQVKCLWDLAKDTDLTNN